MFYLWMPLAVATILMCLMLAGVMQQYVRQSANSPQVQLAEDTTAAIEGNRPTSIQNPAGEMVNK